VALRSNSRDAQLAAVREGVGLACLPCFLGDGVPGVVKVADDGPLREVWLGVHADLRHMPRIRAVIEALDAEFAWARNRLAGLG
jgi:DNA-binding transcriptional LysR family regulator